MDKFQALRESGKQLIKEGKFEEAVAAYSEALLVLDNIEPEVLAELKVDLRREKAITHTNIGVAYFGLKQFDAAVGCYKQAVEADDSYDKAYFRHSQCLEKIGEFKQALSTISRIQAKNASDADISALVGRLVKRVKEETSLSKSMGRLSELMAADNVEAVSVIRDGRTEACRQFRQMGSISDDILHIYNDLDRCSSIKEMLKTLAGLHAILSRLPVDQWQALLDPAVYLRFLSLLSTLVERIDSRDIDSVYTAMMEVDEEPVKKMYRYLWENVRLDGRLEEILQQFPVYLSHMDAIDLVSLHVYQHDSAHIDKFMTIVYKRVKKILDRSSASLNNLQKIALEAQHQHFSAFVERVSRVNSKQCKQFLLILFKTISKVCGCHIYKLLFKNVAHLYRDNFSFQSILLMNSIVLSDYPLTLEVFVKDEKLFIPSVDLLVQHLAHLLANSPVLDDSALFKLENTYQLLHLCVSNRPFLAATAASPTDFRENLKKMLEASYLQLPHMPPHVLAKCLICITVVIIEVFPASTDLLDELIPLSKIAYLLKIADTTAALPFDLSEFVSDVLDILNYICKSENHVSRVAANTEIYKLIKTAIDHVKQNRHLVLHSAIAIASSLLSDKTKRNFEIANDKWGCDMEGFMLLEKIRDKASKQTPTLVGKYSKVDIKASRVKMKLLKDMSIASYIAEYFVELKANTLSSITHENILLFLLDLAEEKEYRCYMVNRALFVYLNEVFTAKDSSKRAKKDISTLIATIGSAINPQSLSYMLQYFVVDVLCHTIEDSAQELYIFEALLALTNFTGYSHEFGDRIFFKNKVWVVVYGHIFDENPYIGNSAIEVLNNLLLNEKVFERVMSTDGFDGQLQQLFSVCDGYISCGVKDYLKEKKQAVEHSSHLVKIKTMLSILCIIDDVPDKMLKYIKHLKLASVCSLYLQVKDQEFLEDLTMKLKFLADNLIKRKTVALDDSSVRVRELDGHFSAQQIKLLSQILS